MIGRGERFCKVVVYLSRDEDEDEDGKFGKRGWWEDQGGKGEGEREDGAWWLVTYLTCISLPLIPYEMRYMSMIMSMNMNILMRMSHSLVVQVQYSLIGFFCFCTTER